MKLLRKLKQAARQFQYHCSAEIVYHRVPLNADLYNRIVYSPWRAVRVNYRDELIRTHEWECSLSDKPPRETVDEILKRGLTEPERRKLVFNAVMRTSAQLAGSGLSKE